MTDFELMSRAIQLAGIAKENNEIPVGAVVSKNGEIIGEGFNRRENGKLSTLHAEIIAIENACKNLGDWRLSDCTIYVTLEPCPMCSGAIVMSRIENIVFGAFSPDGAIVSKCRLPELYESKFHVVGGYMKNECEALLSSQMKQLLRP